MRKNALLLTLAAAALVFVGTIGVDAAAAEHRGLPGSTTTAPSAAGGYLHLVPVFPSSTLPVGR